MIRRFVLAVLVTGIVFSLFACGGPGSGGGGGNKGTASTPVNVNMGDAPSDRIVSCALTINSIAVTNGTSSTLVLSTPTQVEFSHLSATVSPLSLIKLTNGSYTGVNITISNPAITIINDAGAVVTTTVNPLSQTSFSVPVTANLNNSASSLNVELNLAQSVTLNLASNPPTATLAPVFTANIQTNTAGSQTPEIGGFHEVTGEVTGTTSSSLTIRVTQAGQTLTFGTNGSTTFNGVAGVSSLQPGNIVQVNGATNADGTLVATSVSLQVGTTTGMELEGMVSGVTGLPATSLSVVTRDAISSTTPIPGPGAMVSVDLSSVPSNLFLVNSSADLTGVSIPFDPSHIAVGQNLEVDYQIASVPPTGATQVQLRDGTWSGTISGTLIPLLNGGTQFTITLPSDSALVTMSAATLHPVTTITVIRQPSTALLNGVAIAPSQPVRVRGPLFFNGADYTLVAVRITTP